MSEAHGGAAGASSVSAYQIKEDGSLQLVNTVAATGQAAACWIVTTPNGRIAYTTNTASGTVSSFSVKSDGTLTLLQAVAASEGGATDMAMSNDGKVLYVLSQATHSVGVYRIDKNGVLAKTNTLTGLPVGDTGLVVR